MRYLKRDEQRTLKLETISAFVHLAIDF